MRSSLRYLFPRNLCPITSNQLSRRRGNRSAVSGVMPRASVAAKNGAQAIYFSAAAQKFRPHVKTRSVNRTSAADVPPSQLICVSHRNKRSVYRSAKENSFDF